MSLPAHRLDPADTTPLEGSTILLVEDDADVRELVRRLLELLGARVVVADHGLDGLRRLRESCPDAILCDLGMPVMDGLEFARRVRRSPRYRRVPLIAVTGRQDQADFVRTCDAGFDAHLVKPVSLDMLRAFAQRLVGRRRDRRPDA